MEKAAKTPEAAIAKKLRNLIKGVVFLLRKGLSNSKLFLDFSALLLKRTHKLIAKLHPQNDTVFAPPSHYEFSCSSSPAFFRRRSHHAVKEVLDMINGGGDSAAPPGFGRSPARQLRIPDSPFPAKESEEEAVRQVNKAADEFIKKFYRELRSQKALALDSPYHDF